MRKAIDVSKLANVTVNLIVIVSLLTFLILIVGNLYALVQRKIGCNRTTRYSNPQIYNQALGLLDDLRSSEQSKWDLTPRQKLSPCIVVKYRDLRSEKEAEEHFLINDGEVKDNYFPIYVDDRYHEADKYLTAFFLLHALTHLRQYIASVDVNQSLTCVNKEVDAFTSQAMFIEALPEKERHGLIDRLLPEPRDLYRELFANILVAREEVLQTCGGFGDCFSQKYVEYIKTLVSKDPYTQRTCSAQNSPLPN